MEYQDRISHLNGSAKTAGEDPRPRKVHHDPGCPDECWSYLFATLNAYATRFTMNFQIIARNGINFVVYKLFEPRSSGNGKRCLGGGHVGGSKDVWVGLMPSSLSPYSVKHDFS